MVSGPLPVKTGSERGVLEHLVDVAVPGAMIGLEQAVGGGTPLLDRLDQRQERLRFVFASAVEPRAPLQSA